MKTRFLKKKLQMKDFHNFSEISFLLQYAVWCVFWKHNDLNWSIWILEHTRFGNLFLSKTCSWFQTKTKLCFVLRFEVFFNFWHFVPKVQYIEVFKQLQRLLFDNLEKLLPLEEQTFEINKSWQIKLFKISQGFCCYF